jgi:hypothetical protein
MPDSTGIVGVISTIDALLRRAKEGGSYTVDVSPLSSPLPKNGNARLWAQFPIIDCFKLLLSMARRNMWCLSAGSLVLPLVRPRRQRPPPLPQHAVLCSPRHDFALPEKRAQALPSGIL